MREYLKKYFGHLKLENMKNKICRFVVGAMFLLSLFLVLPARAVTDPLALGTWTTLTPPWSDTYMLTAPMGVSGNTVITGYYGGFPFSGFLFDGTNWLTVTPPWPVGDVFIPTGISGSKIVGIYQDNIAPYTHPFLFDGTTWATSTFALHHVPSGVNLINPLGISGNKIVGLYYDSEGSHGFLFDGQSWVTLDQLHFYNLAISGNYILGYSGVNGEHYVIYDGKSWTPIDPDPGHWTGISGRFIVGSNLYSGDPSAVYHGLLYDFISHKTVYLDAYSQPISTCGGDYTCGTAPQAIDGNHVVGTYSASGGGTVPFFYNIPTTTISSLGQFNAANLTEISTGGTASENPVVLQGSPMSINGGQAQLQVEVRPAGVGFTGIPTAMSGFVPSGDYTSVTVSNLANGQYHWQARAKDTAGNVSPWLMYSYPAGDDDFTIGSGLPAFSFFSEYPNGLATTTFNYPEKPFFKVNYTNSSGGTDGQVNVVVDGVSHPMTKSLDIFYPYYFWSPDAFADGPHSYHFEASDGINSVRMPESGEFEFAQLATPILTNLGQFKFDGITPIAIGATTTEPYVVLRGTPTSPSVNQVQLQVEIQPVETAFTGVPTATSSFVASGSVIAIIAPRLDLPGLTDGQYHWRARAVDVQGNVSAWIEYGSANTPDFAIQLPLSSKAAELAKLVIGADYLGDGKTYGGKGWDPLQSKYVTSPEIFTGYSYWNSASSTIKFDAGLDCSGVVQWSYNRSFDPLKSLTHNAVRWDGANGQYHHNTTSTTEADLKPGDLLFFGTNNNGVISVKHVAMYVGEYLFNNGIHDVVEAASPAYGIVASNKSSRENSPTSPLFLGQNDGLRSVVFSPEIGGSVKAGSPVDLTVIDPDGYTITATTSIQTGEEFLTEVPEQLYYTQSELGPDGFPEDMVYWPKEKTGDYVIKVTPKVGAPVASTYSLTFQSGDNTVLLAQNEAINLAPDQGYGITMSTSGPASTFIPVAIDIKPGTYPNSINLGSNGVVPVAIFGSATLDAHQIDPTSITIANAAVKLKGNGQPMANYSDVNGDEFTDITVQVSTEALQLTPADVKADLTAHLTDGTIIKGSDSVRIVPQ